MLVRDKSWQPQAVKLYAKRRSGIMKEIVVSSTWSAASGLQPHPLYELVALTVFPLLLPLLAIGYFLFATVPPHVQSVTQLMNPSGAARP